MTIEILGDGCFKCRELEKNARQAVADAAPEAEIVVTSDPGRIAHYHLLTLPGLAIDGELKVRGRLPTAREIAKLFRSL
jgi:small redox-active disulfide protein 2